MNTTKDRFERTKLELNDLDMVVGGGTLLGYEIPGSVGGYFSIQHQLLGNGGAITFSYGTDGFHAYSTDAKGIGNGGSVGFGAGVWTSDTPNGSDFFTGPGQHVSIAAGEGMEAGVEVSTNDHGFSAGVTYSPFGASAGGVDFSASKTYGREVSFSSDSVDTHSPTVSMPEYDALGNTTGFTTEVPNPHYTDPQNVMATSSMFTAGLSHPSTDLSPDMTSSAHLPAVDINDPNLHVPDPHDVQSPATSPMFTAGLHNESTGLSPDVSNANNDPHAGTDDLNVMATSSMFTSGLSNSSTSLSPDMFNSGHLPTVDINDPNLHVPDPHDVQSPATSPMFTSGLHNESTGLSPEMSNTNNSLHADPNIHSDASDLNRQSHDDRSSEAAAANDGGADVNHGSRDGGDVQVAEASHDGGGDPGGFESGDFGGVVDGTNYGGTNYGGADYGGVDYGSVDYGSVDYGSVD